MALPAGDKTAIRLMIVDDDVGILRALQMQFERSGHQVVAVQDATAAIGMAEEESPDVVLCDIQMPRLSGTDLLKQLKTRKPDTEIVLMTGFASIKAAVEAVKHGAYDFLTKPFEDFSVVELAVEQAAEHKRLRERTQSLEAEIEARDRFEGLIGGTPQMANVFRMIETVARSDATVLVQGESGTGKELVARALHVRSGRKARSFLAISCSALPEGLIESELFGHAKGAFTGAIGAKKGLFEAADRGTLFLDEVGDLPLSAQVQLLRALQEGEVRRVGSNEITRVDVRVVAATNVDLGEARAEGRFREDLFYRLNVIAIRLPALRERAEDIPALAQHFLTRSAARLQREPPTLDDQALGMLRGHAWPGNVRELENAMERAVLLAHGGRITAAELPPTVAGVAEPSSEAQLTELPYLQAKRNAIQAFERRYLGALMRRTAGNLSEAGRLAGVDRSNFRRLLKANGVAYMEDFSRRRRRR